MGNRDSRNDSKCLPGETLLHTAENNHVRVATGTEGLRETLRSQGISDDRIDAAFLRDVPIDDASNYVEAQKLADDYRFVSLTELYEWCDKNQVHHFSKGRRHFVHGGQFLNAHYTFKDLKDKADQREGDRKGCEAGIAAIANVPTDQKPRKERGNDLELSPEQRERLSEIKRNQGRGD
jgi:hypothetical protein